MRFLFYVHCSVYTVALDALLLCLCQRTLLHHSTKCSLNMYVCVLVRTLQSAITAVRRTHVNPKESAEGLNVNRSAPYTSVIMEKA